MIRHIVMWKLKKHAEKAAKLQNALKIVEQLESLKGGIAEIVQLEAGRNMIASDDSFDVALYASFVTKDDLEAYRTHAKHVEVAAFIDRVAERRIVFDYEI